MDEHGIDPEKVAKGQWMLTMLRQDPDMFACWGTLDANGIPWGLGLFDAVEGGRVSLYGRYDVAILSPYVDLRDLPATREPFKNAGWPAGLCLSVPHYSGVTIYFHQYEDGSGGVEVVPTEGCGGGDPLLLHVPYPVITEYLACTLVPPLVWHERPGWIRNPVPLDLWPPDGRIPELDSDAERQAKAQWARTSHDAIVAQMLARL